MLSGLDCADIFGIIGSCTIIVPGIICRGVYFLCRLRKYNVVTLITTECMQCATYLI